MKKSLLLKILVCIVASWLSVYQYLKESNRITRLSMMVPKLEQQLYSLREKNARLIYEIEQFESPAHLIELARQCDFSHLNHPFKDDILFIALDQLRTIEPVAGEVPFEKFTFESKAIVAQAR